MAAAPPFPGYPPTAAPVPPSPSPFPSAQPPPYGVDPNATAQPQIYYNAPPAGYIVTNEQTPLVGAPVYATHAVYADPDAIHHMAHALRRRGIWMILVGTFILVAGIALMVALIIAANFWFVSFGMFIGGGVFIGMGIRNIRLASHLRHHGVLP